MPEQYENSSRHRISPDNFSDEKRSGASAQLLMELKIEFRKLVLYQTLYTRADHANPPLDPIAHQVIETSYRAAERAAEEAFDALVAQLVEDGHKETEAMAWAASIKTMVEDEIPAISKDKMDKLLLEAAKPEFDIFSVLKR